MRPWNGHCQRCWKKTGAYIMSMLNEQLICMDCKDAERERDDYAAAEATDLREYADRMVSVHGCPVEQADNVRRAAEAICPTEE